MRLNLGCSTDVKPGFVNLDCRDIEGVTRCDVSDPAAMEAYRGAGLILAYDVLEHLDRKQARSVLAMWIDLLAAGGEIRLRCPDFRHACGLNHPDEWVELLLYGGQDYPENHHRCGFTIPMLSGLLKGLGMEVTGARHTAAGNLEIEAVKQGRM